MVVKINESIILMYKLYSVLLAHRLSSTVKTAFYQSLSAIFSFVLLCLKKQFLLRTKLKTYKKCEYLSKRFLFFF